MKHWLLQPTPPPEFVVEHPELPPTVLRLLWNRNIKTQEQIDEFLNPDYIADIHDPFLFKDMNKALEIINTAIDQQKNIVVHGDYDADGVTASVILVNTLRKLGAKNVTVFLPHREIDGYGINLNTVKLFTEQKIDLIITCDCGISNYPEIKAAKEAGMQVIITDHHSIPAELPPADAIIHPKVPGEPYPDKGLAGGAVAFKLASGLLKKHHEKTELLPDGQTHEAFEKWLLDLVAIATIGDMVPLVGESRTLARYGLAVLNKTRNLGLQKLCFIAGIGDETGRPKRGSYDATSVGFQIVPRLNAAGRMDHANAAFALLLASTPEEALKLAEQLNQNNLDRQKLTENCVSEARAQIKSTNQTDNPILFAFNENWTTGILGLVAGKLKDEYGRPAIVLGINDGEVVGSGRSISEFSLIGALQSMPEFFDKFGGHPQACGLTLKSLDKMEDFKTALIAKAKIELVSKDLTPNINIDAEVDLDEVDWKLFDLLQKFEPFGQNNERPKYSATNLTVTKIDPIGQDGKHLRLMVKHNSHLIRKTIAFGFGDVNRHPMDWKEILKPGDKIDIAFSIDVNEWNGNRELELKIEDIKKAS